MAYPLVVRRISELDRTAIKAFLQEHWGDSRIITSRSDHEGSVLPGFIVYLDDLIVGLLTYHISGDACELVTINSTLTDRGIGSKLLRSLEDEVAQEGCKRIWAITTNANLRALRFYQKRGYELKAIYVDSIIALRLKKPNLPLIGEEGIFLRSEIEVEKKL
ncbi:MAG: GNAT family N-acetyltransferase [Symbiobacteriaceae bacterium]|nr:GNAT family N-acetyltransferase [Symbiobacteriaceae bacterium]